MKQGHPVIVGIDPSLTSTGIAIVCEGQVLYTERVQTKLRGHDRIAHIIDRIDSALCQALEQGEDQVIVGIEGTAYGAKGSSVVQIFGLWGILTHTIWEWGHPYYVVAPSARAKYATGHGNANKKTVLAAMRERHPDVEFPSDDVADALAIAAIGARILGEPIDGELDPACLAAIEKSDWVNAPEVKAA